MWGNNYFPDFIFLIVSVNPRSGTSWPILPHPTSFGAKLSCNYKKKYLLWSRSENPVASQKKLFCWPDRITGLLNISHLRFVLAETNTIRILSAKLARGRQDFFHHPQCGRLAIESFVYLQPHGPTPLKRNLRRKRCLGGNNLLYSGCAGEKFERFGYIRFEPKVNFTDTTNTSKINTLEGCYDVASTVIQIFLRPESEGGLLTAVSSTTICAKFGFLSRVQV